MIRPRFSFFVSFWVASLLAAQPTVYVTPVPQPDDPNYLTYQLQQLSQTLARSQVDAARVDAFRSQAELNRSLADRIEQDELDALISLAELLEKAGTDDQKAMLRVLIQEKLDELIPVTLRSFPPNTTIVISTPGFPWAAIQVSRVLVGEMTALDIGYGEALQILDENPNVVGLVEVEVNVYQAFEAVKVICYDKNGEEVWDKKTILNSGGGPETLARQMVGRLVKKVKGRSCPD